MGIPRHGYTDWTDARKLEVRDMWADGKTAGFIAGYFSDATATTVTRSSIIGLCHRNGYKQPVANKHLEDHTSLKATKHVRKRTERHPPDLPQDDDGLFDQPVPAEFLGLTFAERQSGQCRYPRGETVPYLFCGQPCQVGSSYCPACHRLTVQTTFLTAAEREIRIREYRRRMGMVA